MANRTKLWRAFCIATLLALSAESAVAACSSVSVSCSAKKGQVVINEVNTDDNFVELYLNQEVDILDYDLWVDDGRLFKLGYGNCKVNGTNTKDNQSTGATSTTWPAGTFLVCDYNMNPSSNEVLLADRTISHSGSPGAVAVDYLRYGTPSHTCWSVPSGAGNCGTLYPGHQSSNKDLARVPDGSGAIADNGDNSTPGTSNSPAVVDHYELSLATGSVACMASTVTVTACKDNSSPCTNLQTGVTGKTVALATSAGTLGAGVISFGSAGQANTTLSFPTAADGATAAVSLSAEQQTALFPRKCCPDGASCVVGNSCSTTFNTAGLIFSAAVGGAVTTIPAQRAGVTSATHYLRAVKTNSATKACEAALSGASSVDFGYECNDPATCSASNLMSLNGGTATTIARNDDNASASPVASYTAVPLLFDANGNAPLTFNFSDVGRVQLYARKAAGGSLLTALSGASNAFVVAPYDFLVTSTGPYVAGESFSASLIARTASGAAAPNFGRETTPETAVLKQVGTVAASANNSELVGPVGGAVGAMTPGNFSAASCSPAVAGKICETGLAWTEVGDVKLSAAISDGDYLGSGLNAWGAASAAVSFRPSFLKTEFDPAQGCGAFTYSGQPFRVKVTAMSKANAILGSAAAATMNYNGSYARAVDIGADGASECTPTTSGFANLSPSPSLAANAFSTDGSASTPPVGNTTAPLPVSYTQPLAAPATIAICARDADGVNSHGQTQAALIVRNGRLKMSNAFGSEKADLALPIQAQYWSGNAWVLASDDSCTGALLGAATPAVALSGYTGTLSSINLGPGHVSAISPAGAGKWNLVLGKPAPPVPKATGSVNVALNLGTGSTDQSCLFKTPATPPVTTGANLPWFRGQYGSRYPDGTACPSSGRDPSARATFGIYSPETKKVINVLDAY